MELKDYLKENIKGIDLLNLLQICCGINEDYFEGYGLLISDNVNELCEGMTPEQIIGCVAGQDVEIYSDYFQLKNWKLRGLDEDETIEIAEGNSEIIIDFYLENREYIDDKDDYTEELIEEF